MSWNNNYGSNNRHSARDCKAYNMGKAYGAGKTGRKIKGLNDRDKKNFRAGYKVGCGNK